ncbi:MAG: tetratricopeptide repeat protein [Deinococcus sp.]|uniref:tetratricopeptide repeat protein n=1 Tax=Deinococcus sp. TaxID=47478 RepID=UPI0026DAE9DD|nr:tetratricopeptide repeat protein [Deinococcus sp.]MDO4247106.1 tetratricopeptide repeat protein [Deinococcus sp.]
MHFSSDAPRFVAARLVLGVALACGASAHAQTLIDTSAAIGVQNTLNQIQPGVTQVPGSMSVQFDACQMAPELCQNGQSVTAPAQPATSQPAAQPAATQSVSSQSSAAQPATAVPTAATPAQQAGQAQAGTPAVTVVPLTPQQQTQLQVARRSLSEGKYAQARSQFENLIVSNYNNPEPHFGLGLVLYNLGDLRGAAFEFGQFMRFAPGRYEGPYNLGVIATREGRYAEALKLYTEALTLAGTTAPSGPRQQILKALASEQSRARDYNGLAATYAALRQADPTNLEYVYRNAQALFLAGRLDEALPATYAVLERKGSSVQAALLLADIYAAQGLPDRAVRELNSAAARVLTGSDRAELLLHKSDLLLGQKDLRGALQAASDARREDTRSVRAYAREAEIQTQLGNRAEAIKAYQAALKLAPKSAAYRADLATLYLAANQYKEAGAEAAQALKLTPDAATQAKAQYVQGVSAYRQGQYAQARNLLNSSVLAVPNADTLLWLGLSYYGLGDYPSAVSVLSESVKLKPTATARQNLASALLATARYTEAEALLRGLVTDEPKNAEGWYLLGLSQQAQKRPDDARQSFKTAANLGEARAKEALK